MHRNILFSLASACVFAIMAATPAAAQSAQQYEGRIPYRDLNFASREGVDAFIGRARLVAGDICGDRMGQMTLREHLMIRECKRDFLERAVASLNNSAVSARYAELGGRTSGMRIAAR